MAEEKAILSIRGKTIEFPVYEGTEGDVAVDISNLYPAHRLMTYDPSLASTAVCQSTVTYIDGEKGILRYRGIPIEQFVTEQPNFIEVAHLLLAGNLPTKEEGAAFRRRLTENELLPEPMRLHFSEIPTTAPPMAILSAAMNQLACYHPEFMELDNDDEFMEISARLISKIRTIAAYIYRRTHCLPFMYPNPNLRYAANFLHMMFSLPYSQYEVSPEIEDALNLVLILHADHEQNCSAATVRVVASSRANLFASCAAGICALWGSLHGGANVAVMEMLDRIHRGGLSPEKCIEMAKDKNDPFKLFGFGHRVYKNYDPRAKILRAACDRVFATLKHQNDPLLNIARGLEELALSDSYFIDRKLYPNVDFYSGLLLRAMGIPTNMFTVMFAMGRLPGWIAQWREQHQVNGRIIRPRQIYTGNTISDYVPIDER
ncbi:MAG: citrate synthase [Thermoguttaceae bacterium]|nr:citrate synthase [Thermoguttaceae bacterium]MBP3694538.1 citrate synthase [Thermoguttaceae bacterium]